MGKEIGTVEVTTGTALIVYDADVDFETRQLELQIKQALEEADRLEEEYRLQLNEATRITLNLNETPEFKPYMDQIEKLQKSIMDAAKPQFDPQEERDKARAKAEAADNADPFAEDDEPTKPSEEDTVELNKKVKPFLEAKRKEKIKKLYRKISLKCHPDKTNDEHLHEVFLEAKEAYRQGAQNQLAYLLAGVNRYLKTKRSVKFRKKSLKQALSDAKAKLWVAKAQKDSAKNELGFVLLDLKEKGREDDMKKVYKQFLSTVIHQLAMRRAQMNTGMHVRRSVYEPYRPTTTTTTTDGSDWF